MLSEKCMDIYRKQYPKDSCFFEESFGDIVITRHFDGKAFYNPKRETDEVFIDRLKRSKECERNLFYEEWEIFEYDEDCDY